jgi:hypothetical protein
MWSLHGCTIQWSYTLKVQNEIIKVSEPSIGVKLQSYEPLASKYINLSYCNKKVLIFDWMVYAEGVSNSPFRKKCHAVNSTVNHTIL